MFTGIVSETGRIRSQRELSGGKEFRIACSFAKETHIDESISVNGVCLTVVERDVEEFRVQCVAETLRKTTLGELKEGDPVNLERSLTLEKALEGHIVQGHVDTTGRIEKIVEDGTDRLLEISYSVEYASMVIGRGSIALDGISLTVAREEGETFTVAVIPYTWDHTNLRHLKVGDRVNLEFDLFGKYITRYMDLRFGREG
ncbi:MAG: riboflavin synthase [Balneolaceae bacterium]